MSDPPFLDEAAALSIARSLSLGLARQPLELPQALTDLLGASDTKQALTVLALVGQSRRFAPPGPPPGDEGPISNLQQDRLVPEALRPLLVRLLGGSRDFSVDAAGNAVAHHLARRRLALHPFDLPLLHRFIAAHGEVLGAYATTWARHRKPTLDDPEIGNDNWIMAKPAAKARFIEARRRRDPEGTRLMLAEALPSFPSSVRADLVSKLEIGLSALDLPFLEEAARARSASVKQIATMLMGRLPDTPAFAARLSDAMTRLKVSRDGPIVTVALETPANIRPFERQAWALAHFAGLRLDSLAGSLGLTVDELIAGAAGDDSLPTLFLALATELGWFGRVEVLAAQAPYAWHGLISERSSSLSQLDCEAQQRWISAAMHPRSFRYLLSIGGVMRLCYFLRAPLPVSTAEKFLQSADWRDRHQVFAKDEHDRMLSDTILTAIATLMPMELRPRFRQDLEQGEPSAVTRPLLTLDVLDAIDQA